MTAPSILLDGTQLLQKRGTGIATYTRTLANALNSLGAKVSLLVSSNSKPSINDPDYALATQIFAHSPPSSRINRLVSSAFRTRFGFRHKVEIFEVDLHAIEVSSFEPALPAFQRLYSAVMPFDHARVLSYFGTQLATLAPTDEFAATHYTGPVPLKSKTGPNIYAIHDLVPIQYPYFVIERPGYSARLHAAIAQAADGIITVSEASKECIVNILKVPSERVTVTHQPSPSPTPLPQDEAELLITSIYGVKPYEYVIYIGAIEPKKNLRRLIEAYTLTGLEIPLLLVGPKGWLYDDEDELLRLIATRSERAADAGEPLVRHLGYLPRRHVVALLQSARFMAFPSIFEGFGLPVLEAMHLGVPVLTSRTPALLEVAGDAAFFVDPLDVDDITSGLRTMGLDHDLRADLAAKGPARAAMFSEERYKERLREAYAKVGLIFRDTQARS